MGPGLGPLSPLAVAPSSGRHVLLRGHHCLVAGKCTREWLFPKSQATQKLSLAYWGWVHSEPITVAVKEHVIASRVICLIWSNRCELGAV